MMIELDSFRVPISHDELPQLVPYMQRLYNVVDTIYANCYYTKENTSSAKFASNTLEPKVLKAITEKTVDRSRYNCFYHPYL